MIVESAPSEQICALPLLRASLRNQRWQQYPGKPAAHCPSSLSLDYSVQCPAVIRFLSLGWDYEPPSDLRVINRSKILKKKSFTRHKGQSIREHNELKRAMA